MAFGFAHAHSSHQPRDLIAPLSPYTARAALKRVFARSARMDFRVPARKSTITFLFCKIERCASRDRVAQRTSESRRGRSFSGSPPWRL